MNSRSRTILAAIVVVLVAGALYWFLGRGREDLVLPIGTEQAPRPAAGGPLLDPQALPDMTLGEATAPVTMIEYASMTCPHCQSFHANTFDALREKYIDSGQVRFIFREFPLDATAALGSVVARCAPPEQFYEIVDILFDNQVAWAGSPDPRAAVYELVKQTGFNLETYDACLTNTELYTNVLAVRAAGQQYGVDSTPTFFINGNKVAGALTLEEMDVILAPLL